MNIQRMDNKGEMIDDLCVCGEGGGKKKNKNMKINKKHSMNNISDDIKKIWGGCRVVNVELWMLN